MGMRIWTSSVMPEIRFSNRLKSMTLAIDPVPAPNSICSFEPILSGNLRMAFTTLMTCWNEQPRRSQNPTLRSYLSMKHKTYHLFSGGSSSALLRGLPRSTSRVMTTKRYTLGQGRTHMVWQDSQKNMAVIVKCYPNRIDYLLLCIKSLKPSYAASLCGLIRNSIPGRIWDWYRYMAISTRWRSNRRRISYYWDGRIRSSGRSKRT